MATFAFHAYLSTLCHVIYFADVKRTTAEDDTCKRSR